MNLAAALAGPRLFANCSVHVLAAIQRHLRLHCGYTTHQIQGTQNPSADDFVVTMATFTASQADEVHASGLMALARSLALQASSAQGLEQKLARLLALAPQVSVALHKSVVTFVVISLLTLC